MPCRSAASQSSKGAWQVTGALWILYVVTGSRRFLGSGHRVTGEFRRSQIVTPVAAECIARIKGVTTPCLTSIARAAMLVGARRELNK